MTRRPWILMAICLPACSGGSGSIAIDDFDDAVIATWCEYVVRCGATEADTAAVKALIDALQTRTCPEVLRESFGSDEDIFQLQSLVEKGTVTYDGKQAAACLAEITSRCLGFDVPSATCAAVFGGTVAAGGACVRDAECADRGQCDQSGNLCPGQCVAPTVALAGACASDDDCQNASGDVACVPDAGGRRRCARVEIGAPAGENAACGSVFAATDRQIMVPCAAGLYCAGGSEISTGVCKEPVAAGANCVQGDVCAQGSLCLPVGLGGQRTCRAFTVRAAGQSCNATNLELCNAFDRLACENSVCVTLGDGAAGSACRLGDLGVGCQIGLYCERGTNVCVAEKPDGGACVEDRECASGVCTGGGAGTCAAAANACVP